MKLTATLGVNSPLLISDQSKCSLPQYNSSAINFDTNLVNAVSALVFDLLY